MKELFAIFCDEIRTEDNGKHLLIGTYATSLVPATLPQSLGLALYFRMTPVPVGSHAFKLRILTHTGDEVGLEGEFSAQEETTDAGIVIPTPKLPVTLVEPGLLTAQLIIDDGEPITISTLQVTAPPKR